MTSRSNPIDQNTGKPCAHGPGFVCVNCIDEDYLAEFPLEQS